jgi:hypothetical protein
VIRQPLALLALVAFAHASARTAARAQRPSTAHSQRAPAPCPWQPAGARDPLTIALPPLLSRIHGERT